MKVLSNIKSSKFLTNLLLLAGISITLWGIFGLYNFLAVIHYLS